MKENLISNKIRMEFDRNKHNRKEVKDDRVNIRISKSMRVFMKKNAISPSFILNEALRQLGYKG